MWTRLRRRLWLRFLRQPLDRLLATPFGRLTAHFLDRLVRGEDTASSEFELGVGGLLGLLAAPGAFYCFLLFDRYSALLAWMSSAGTLEGHVLLVGHQPLLGDLVRRLTGGEAPGFAPGDLIRVEFAGPAEPGAGKLTWSVGPADCV